MRKKFTTSLEEELIDFLKILAVKEGRNASDILNEIVQAHKEKIERKED